MATKRDRGPMMVWSDLKLLLALARRGTLVEAAEELGLDPAVIGQRMALLEQTFGAKLFFRTPEGWTPTEAGMRAVARAIGNFEYDPEKGTFRSWFYTVARSKLNNHFSRQARAPVAGGGTVVMEMIKFCSSWEWTDAK